MFMTMMMMFTVFS